ncbi:MAG: hypothetical protein IIW12_06140 [Oscillospiraceae bacterium]|nr:hypothetical protein [Oscillospiraceae bacterium]
MKRTDITDLWPEAPKEAIDKLMAINGADVNASKAEIEDLKQKLAAAANSDELQKAQQQAAQLQQELDTMKAAETIRLTREKVAGEKKVPAHLLTGETEEACAKQADEILAFAQPSGYPQIRDGGDPRNPPAPTTRQKFADWAKDNL